MNKYKIVIVENDEDEQIFIEDGFRKSGLFEIKGVVSNGDDLFDWMALNQNELPEIILSDLNMPGKNGYDILTEVRDTPQYSNIPVIITSTSSAKSIMEKCLSLGAADYVVKPETFIQYPHFAKELHGVIEASHLVKKKP